jgi:hypothetical protein
VDKIKKTHCEKSFTSLVNSAYGKTVGSEVLKRFQERPLIYKIGKELSSDLKKVNLSISTGYLAKLPEFFCVELPDMLVLTVPGNPNISQKPLVIGFPCAYIHKAADGLFIQFPELSEIGYGHDLATAYVRLDSTKALSDVIDETLSLLAFTISGVAWKEQQFRKDLTPEEYTKITNTTLGWFSAVVRELLPELVNYLVYIISGQPDLRSWRPPPRPKSKKPKVVRNYENLSSVPITLVGYNWKKATIYSVDSTTVSGHFRWQPYGKELSMVKLIWIDAHTRTYNNENERQAANG